MAHQNNKSASLLLVFQGSSGSRKHSLQIESKIADGLSKAWKRIQSLHGTDDENATREPWKAYQTAVISLVQEHKEALYSSAHVRRCIDHAVLAGDKQFFIKLGRVLPAGVGLDKRIEKQLPLARKADRLHRSGKTWAQVVDVLDPEARLQLDAETIRILVRRYRSYGLL